MQMSVITANRISIAITLLACAISTWLLLKLKEAKRVRGSSEEKDLSVEVSNCQDCQALSNQYQKMDEEFTSGGLNLNSIRAIQPWFHGVKGNDSPWPKRYEVFPEPLPPRSVRLLVIPLEGSASLSAAGAAITRDLLGILPPSAKTFSNARTHYHCTLWHTSRPTDTRPDPLAVNGGLDSTLLTATPGKRPMVKATTLAHEKEVLAWEVSRTNKPTLVVDRVLMASSGTLLITWVDPSGRVKDLRARLRQAFPGSPQGQATIIHTSLVRIVSDDQLDKDTIEAVRAMCERWTNRLKGKVMVPEATWWIYESEFSSIFGDKVNLNFA